MQNTKAELIIASLLVSPTIRKASENLNIPESTIYKYLKNPEFKTRYNEAKSNLLNQSSSYLQSKISEAISNIIDVMNDVNTAHQVRLNASKAVLDYAMKLNEQTNILCRIEELEGLCNIK